MSPWLIAGLVIGGLLLLFIILGAIGSAGTTPEPEGKGWTCNKATFTCVADPAGLYTQAECTAQCNDVDQGCDPQGTRQNPDGTAILNPDKTCACRPGIAGPLCNACVEGKGPGFPCCDRSRMTWTTRSAEQGNNAPFGMVTPCIGPDFTNGNDDESRSARLCYGSSLTNCQATSTWTGEFAQTGSLNVRLGCEQWVSAINGRPVRWDDSYFDDDARWRDDFARAVTRGDIVHGEVFCSDPGALATGSNTNSGNYTATCVPAGAATCTLNGDTWTSTNSGLSNPVTLGNLDGN